MQELIERELASFLDKLGLAEEPMGLVYSDRMPEGAISPPTMEPPTPEREQRGEINWQAVFASFSCVMGVIWRARQKKIAAVFAADQPGCPGGSFFLGYHKPQTEAILRYVTSGIPGWTEGEHYCESPEALRAIFTTLDPCPAPGKYCIVKPLRQFKGEEEPRLVIFFARPEPLCGLHQLATFVTNDPEVVMSPWAAACGSIAAWPFHYLGSGAMKAVLGGWDPSARKFFRPDELSFTVPFGMFVSMLERFRDSFLMTDTWSIVQKKAARSERTWGARSNG